MAFEAFPTDAIDAFNDPGICYVRENGKLRSPPGLGPTSRQATISYDTGLPKLSPFYIGESDYDGSTRFIPRSLFQQTIDFVARNLFRVESLVGFPEIVGEQIFRTAEAQGVFGLGNKHLRLTGLRLFTEAFNTEVLSNLCVRKNHKMLSNFLDEILLFSGLREVELGGCKLDEEHDIWAHIGSVPCLQRLGLGETGLTDVVLQKFTTPLRLMGRGPKNLEVLDLSGNRKVTDRSIRFLRVFHHLNSLDISGCGLSPYGLSQLQNEMYLRQLEEDELDDKSLDPFCRPVENIGWASRVVQRWISGSRASTEESVPQGYPKARKFYSSSSSRLGFLDVSKKDALPVSSSSQPVVFIRLVKDPKDRGRAYMTEAKPKHQTKCKRTWKGMKERRHIPPLVSKRVTLEQEILCSKDKSVSDCETTCIPRTSNQGAHKCAPREYGSQKSAPQKCVPLKEEATGPPSSKPGLKVKMKKKRKRCPSGHDVGKGIVPSGNFVDDDDDDDDGALMRSYYKKRTDGDVDLDKTGDNSKLMKAMESSNW